MESLVEGYLPNAAYVAYQSRYAIEPRESDKALLGLLTDALAGVERPRITDVGCSTGNLLKHLRATFPEAVLAGGDLAHDAVAACLADPDLAGINVSMMDVTSLAEDDLDAVIVNAVLCTLGDDAFLRSLASIARSIRPGGVLATFDWYHPFPQELTILERSESYPDGATLHWRSMTGVEQLLRQQGFTEIAFHPFEIPIDLSGDVFGDNSTGYESLNSVTKRLEDGKRLIFRGALSQPWCHLVARKAGL